VAGAIFTKTSPVIEAMVSAVDDAFSSATTTAVKDKAIINVKATM
jgi:hypothetical protein